MLPPVADHRRDGFERLFAGHIQLHAQVQIGSGQKNVQSWGCRRLQRFERRAHILFFRACQRRNRHVADFLCHHLHGFQVASRGDRETRFDHVHVQRRKLAGHPQLFVRIHRKARRLLAVT